MGTQGLLTILKNDECVLAKVAVGCNGYNIDKVKKKIRNQTLKTFNLDDIYKIALNEGFGCEKCLVVSFMRFDGKLDHIHIERISEEALPWYWTKFDIKDFNPRWECGIVEYYDEVKIEWLK